MNELRPGLPPLPERMRDLPIDHRGFPVPYFVAWVDGQPDHRIADPAKMGPAVQRGLCWQCGKPLGAFKTFVIGPMCCITRTISEPPSHIDCARFAATACPFLSRPHAKRRAAGLPDIELKEAAGVGLKRNPGAVCLWTTKTFQGFNNRSPDGSSINGVLFRLGDPTSIEWYAEGRKATREEVEESVRTGLPMLEQTAREDDEYNDALPAPALRFTRERKPGSAQVALKARVAAFEKMLADYFS